MKQYYYSKILTRDWTFSITVGIEEGDTPWLGVGLDIDLSSRAIWFVAPYFQISLWDDCDEYMVSIG